MQITRRSIISGIDHTRDIPVDPNDYLAWQSGVAGIHVLMPYLTDIDREFILSGIVADEWDEYFSSNSVEFA